MLRDYLPVVEELGILQGVSLILFFVFFLLIVVWVLRMDKTHIHNMEILPLDSANSEIKTPGDQNE